MKISDLHIFRHLALGIKGLCVSLWLACPLCAVQAVAQSDTCFVTIDITQAQPFALVKGSQGELTTDGGQQVLSTPCTILKIVNKSTGIAVDKNNGRFRVLTFTPGAATAYDYTRNGTKDGPLVFTSVNATNMRDFIYFLLPKREAAIAFRLEGQADTERRLVTRHVEAAQSAPASPIAPADKKPVEANDLQTPAPQKTPAATEPVADQAEGSSGSWLPWLIALLAVAASAGYAYYLKRKEEQALWADPIKGGDESIVPAEQRVMVKQIRDLQQRLQASIASDRDHALRLEHSEKDRKEAIARANKAEEDFKKRADKAEEDFRKRAEEAEKDFNKRAEQAEKTAEDRSYSAEQQARSRVAAAQQKSEQEIAAAQQKAEQEIAEAQQKAEQAIATAQHVAEEQITQAIEDKIKGIEEAREEAYQRATREFNEHVDAIQAEATAHITSAESIANEAVADRQAAIDAACQPLQEHINQLNDLQRVHEAASAQAIAEKDQTIQNLTAEKEATIALMQDEKNTAIALAQDEKNTAIALAQEEKETAIASMLEEKNTAIALAQEEKNAAIAQAQKEKETAIASMLEEKEQAITAAQTERDEAIALAQTERDEAIALAQASSSEAIAKAQEEKEQSIAIYRDSHKEEQLNQRNRLVAHIKSLLDRVDEQMTLIKDGIDALGTDNNYSNTSMHMARKENDFVCWFDKNILEAGDEGPMSADDVRQMMQEQIMVLLSGNYSWLTELLRFKAYAGISADFQREFKRSGIPVEAIRSAHTAMEAIMGMLGISVIVPQLFAEEFNLDLHRNTNAPIVNSFYPKGFDEHRQQLRGIICDVTRVGVELDGLMVQVPEVSIF